MELQLAEAWIEDGDWEPIFNWLSALADADRPEVVRWYRSSLRAKARKKALNSWHGDHRLIQLALAVALAETPDEAVKGCAWKQSVFSNGLAGHELELGLLLLARGSDWSREFVLEASYVVTSRDVHGPTEIAVMASPVVFGPEPMEVGDNFYRGWSNLLVWAKLMSAGFGPHGGGKWNPPRLTLPAPTGGAAYAYPATTTLIDVLASIPRLTDVFVRVLAVPDLLLDWQRISGHPDWEVDTAIAALIARGSLDRTVLIDNVAIALTRSDKPNAQRVMAKILRGVGIGGDDVAARGPWAAQIMSMANGAVTAVLLDAVLKSSPSDELLREIGTVVLVRKEKAQKKALLNYLAKSEPSAARSELLALASEDSDASLAAVASTAAGELVEAGAPTWEVEWQFPVAGREVARFTGWPADAAGFDAAYSDSQTWIRITSEAARLDLFVRIGYDSTAALKKLVPSMNEYGGVGAPSTHNALRLWAATGATTVSYERTSTSMLMGPEGVLKTEKRTYTLTPPGYIVFGDQVVAEAFSRIGKIRELLSTPSFSDGTVTLDDLAARLRRAGRVGVGPYDLVQALLRLEPTAPADAGRLDGVSARLAWGDERPSFGLRRSIDDAAEVVRTWVRAGGLPDRIVKEHEQALAIAEVSLPLPERLRRLDGIAELCAAFDPTQKGVHLWWGDPHAAVLLGVVPRWSDAAAAIVVSRSKASDVGRIDPLNMLTSAPGTFGAGVHFVLAHGLSHQRQDRRMAAADYLLTIARQGRLDPEVLAEQSLSAYAAGALSLSRLATAWNHILLSGGLGFMWPTMRAVIEAACGSPKRPAGLADVLRVLTPTARTIAANTSGAPLPKTVIALAAGNGKTKAEVEARLLAAAFAGTTG